MTLPAFLGVLRRALSPPPHTRRSAPPPVRPVTKKSPKTSRGRTTLLNLEEIAKSLGNHLLHQTQPCIPLLMQSPKRSALSHSHPEHLVKVCSLICCSDFRRFFYYLSYLFSCIFILLSDKAFNAL